MSTTNTTITVRNALVETTSGQYVWLDGGSITLTAPAPELKPTPKPRKPRAAKPKTEAAAPKPAPAKKRRYAVEQGFPTSIELSACERTTMYRTATGSLMRVAVYKSGTTKGRQWAMLLFIKDGKAVHPDGFFWATKPEHNLLAS